MPGNKGYHQVEVQTQVTGNVLQLLGDCGQNKRQRWEAERGRMKAPGASQTQNRRRQDARQLGNMLCMTFAAGTAYPGKKASKKLTPGYVTDTAACGPQQLRSAVHDQALQLLHRGRPGSAEQRVITVGLPR